MPVQCPESVLPDLDIRPESVFHCLPGRVLQEAGQILRSLIENYANHSHKPGEALLLHGVYSWHSGKGIDVGNIWGDYYYVEALVRFLKDWKVWW